MHDALTVFLDRLCLRLQESPTQRLASWLGVLFLERHELRAEWMRLVKEQGHAFVRSPRRRQILERLARVNETIAELERPAQSRPASAQEYVAPRDRFTATGEQSQQAPPRRPRPQTAGARKHTRRRMEAERRRVRGTSSAPLRRPTKREAREPQPETAADQPAARQPPSGAAAAVDAAQSAIASAPATGVRRAEEEGRGKDNKRKVHAAPPSRPETTRRGSGLFRILGSFGSALLRSVLKTGGPNSPSAARQSATSSPVSESAAYDTGAPENVVRQWLKEIDMGQYADVFIGHGWDDMPAVVHMKQEDLANCGVRHSDLVRLQAALAEAKRAMLRSWMQHATKATKHDNGDARGGDRTEASGLPGASNAARTPSVVGGDGAGQAAVRRWLGGIQMGRYADAFIEQGWDEMTAVVHMKQEDLANCGVRRSDLVRLLPALARGKKVMQGA